MEKGEAVSILSELASEADNVRGHPTLFNGWLAKCRAAFDRVFGRESAQLRSLESVEYGHCGPFIPGDDGPDVARFHAGLEAAQNVVRAAVLDVKRFGLLGAPEVVTPSVLLNVETICRRFHLVVRQLRCRRGERPSLDVADEYDVQDLLHSLLRLYFDDIRPEEWTPSYAGGSSRMDFLLKREKIVIECKKTRVGLDARKVGDELTIDIARYRAHPDCRMLVCFVYDPDDRIVNPAGLEGDLSEENAAFSVKVIITSK